MSDKCCTGCVNIVAVPYPARNWCMTYRIAMQATQIFLRCTQGRLRPISQEDICLVLKSEDYIYPDDRENFYIIT